MDIKEVEERDGARAILNVSEEREYLHADYDLVLRGGRISRTGLLSIAILKLKNPGTGPLPEFLLRWDDKDDRIDVDPLSEPKEERRFPRRRPRDYRGHHSVRISISPRVFEVDLVWEGQSIYRGRLKFNLSIDLSARDQIVLEDNTSTSPTS